MSLPLPIDPKRATASRISRKDPQSQSGAPDLEKIKSDGLVGIEELNRVFGSGVRWMLSRRAGTANLEARVEMIFAAVVEELRGAGTRTPQSLASMVRRAVNQRVEDFSESVPVHVPPENVAAAQEAVHALSSRDRDILVRYYVGQESREMICQESDMPERQFGDIKSRLRSRFAQIKRPARIDP